MNQILRKIISLPKPLLFGLIGAIGCSAGWLIGEPLLLIIRPTQKQIESGDTSQVLVFGPEFDRRLKREGAQSGDIQISLMWNNINDLDLHCIDPNGEHICFSNKRAQSKGELDVDMNVSPPLSNEPVENIYWTSGQAPSGSYKIGVDHYKSYGASDPTPFKVAVKVADEIKEFSGEVSSGDQFLVVNEFTLNKQIERIKGSQGSMAEIVVIGLWTSMLATGLATALTCGQNTLLRRKLLTRRQAFPLVAGGIIAGLIAGSISQVVFTTLTTNGSLAWFGRILGWIVLGGIMGYGMSYVIPNLPRNKSVIAGAVGGLCGALTFLFAVVALPDFLARLLGAVILGSAIGLMIAWAEKLAREACLIVHWGAQERTIINLGERPVVLGSSNEAELYLPKEKGFPPITALVSFREGKIQMENKMTNNSHELKSGNKLQLAELLVEVRTDS